MARTPRKTIFVNRFFYPDHSATSQLLSDLAFDLARDGMAVEVLASRQLYGAPHARLPRRDVVNGVIVHRVWTTRFGRSGLLGRAIDYLTFYLSAALTLCWLTNKETIVVIKTDPPLMALVAAPIVWLRGARWVNWLQDLFPEVAGALGVRLARGAFMYLMKAARNATLHGAYANVVLGLRMAQRLNAESGLLGHKTVVIHNWADGKAIQPIPREINHLRADWGLASCFVVGYSGNLGRAHEFQTFLGAAQTLQRRQEIVFLFVGDGAQRAAVEAAAQRRGLANVLFRPYQAREQLGQSLSVADVHLVSLNPDLEGLIVPSKFYGIAAAGRPTLFVGDTNGEIAMQLRQHNCGFSVATGDSAALAERIAQLADDPALCVALGAHARNLLQTRYDRLLAVAHWKKVLS